MRIATALLLVSSLVPLGARLATAQATALTTSASPASMIVSTAVAGSQPAPITNAATTYFVKVRNSAGVKKITARLSAAMPAGTTLTLNMVPPAGATSLGPVILSTTTKDVVVNISRINPGATQGITYVFSATVLAGVVPSQSRTVTLTLANYP